MELTYDKGLIVAFGLCEEHKLTEQILKAGFQTAGIDYKYHVISMEEKSEEKSKEKSLEEAVKTAAFLNMHGFQLAKPFQKKVLPFLDDLSLVAGITGQVNVVANHDGDYVGENTLAKGLVTCMMFRDMLAQGHTFIIEGEGELAAVAMVELAVSGADKIYLCTEDEAETLPYIQKVQQETDTEIVWTAWRNPLEIPGDVDIVVHAAESFSDKDGLGEKMCYEGLHSNMVLCNMQLFRDEIYRSIAEEAGVEFIDAKEIFFHKIRLHFSLWTEHFIELTGMLEAMETGLAELKESRERKNQQETKESSSQEDISQEESEEKELDCRRSIFHKVLSMISENTEKVEELMMKKSLALEIGLAEKLPEEEIEALEIALTFSMICDEKSEESEDFVWNGMLECGCPEEMADRSMYLFLHYLNLTEQTNTEKQTEDDLALQILMDTDLLWQGQKYGRKCNGIITKSGGKIAEILNF